MNFRERFNKNKNDNNNMDTLPLDGNEDIPEQVRASYPSSIDAKKISKKIKVLIVDAHKGSMPRLVFKPRIVNYGTKWVLIGNYKYWIIYDYLVDYGKFYVYTCQFGNSVGGLKYEEHMEFADGNQVELMVNQHAVEVMKKHKGISQRLFMFVVIGMVIGMVGMIIMSQFLLGMNSQINNLTNQNNNLKTQIEDLQNTSTNNNPAQNNNQNLGRGFDN